MGKENKVDPHSATDLDRWLCYTCVETDTQIKSVPGIVTISPVLLSHRSCAGLALRRRPLTSDRVSLHGPFFGLRLRRSTTIVPFFSVAWWAVMPENERVRTFRSSLWSSGPTTSAPYKVWPFPGSFCSRFTLIATVALQHFLGPSLFPDMPKKKVKLQLVRLGLVRLGR